MGLLPASLAFFLAFFVPAPRIAGAERWVPLGPPGGDVRKIVADPSAPGAAYLGTSDGALYRSEDAGLTWRRLDPGFPRRGMSLDDILVQPDGALLLGFWAVGSSGGGIARSVDGGRTFAFLAGMEGKSVRGLALARADPNILVAAALDGVHRSDDGGLTWRRISREDPAQPGLEEQPGLRNFGSIALDPTDADTVYAGTWRLPWKTTDAGRSWRLIQLGMIVDSDVMTLTIDRRSPARVYATACSGIYRSLDGAAHWARIQGIPSSSRRTRAFAQDPRRPEVFYAGTTEGLFVSEDDTRTWRRVTRPDLVINTIEILGDGTLLLGCDAVGVMRSTDGGRTWAESANGLYERPVAAALFELGRLLVGVGGGRQQGGVWSLPWPNGSWTRLGSGLEEREVLTVVSGARGPLAGTDDGLFRFEAETGTWRSLATVVGGIDVRPRVTGIAAPEAALLLLATPRGLLRSCDGGTTWTRQTLGETQAVLALGAGRGGTLYAATPLGAFASTDGGASWTRLAAAPGDGLVRSLAVSPTDDRVVFAATTHGLVKTSDGGFSWRWRGGGLPRTDIAALAIHPDGQTLYAGDHLNGGLYRSDTAGESWELVAPDGLHSGHVWNVALESASGALVVGGATGGLYQRVVVGGEAAGSGGGGGAGATAGH